MKKYLSFILSASLALSALAPATVFSESAESSALTLDNIVVFGDSISNGYGLNDSENSYAEICADYFGSNLDNFSKDGLDSSELLEMFQTLTDEQKNSIAKSDVVVISTGGNDILQYIIKSILNFAAPRSLLKEGYTAEDIPEKPSASSIKMLNMNAFKEYADGSITHTLALDNLLTTFTDNLSLTTGSYRGIIHNEIMVNIDKIVKIIKEINPDTQIVVQTVYQPFQLSQDYISKNHGTGYAMMLTQLRTKLNFVMDTFRNELMQIENIEVVDVLDTFTALENGLKDSKDATPGYAYYFTNIQKPYNAGDGEESMDLHPNQKGHLAISSLLIDTIKVRNAETNEWLAPAPAERPVDNETGEAVPTLFNATFDSIEDIADYPPLAMEQIVETIPDKVVPGDVDGNGKIDAVDASAISIEYANLSTIDGVPTFTEEQNKKADINYDGRIDARDATYASMYYAYLSTTQPGEEEMNIFHFINQKLINN
ncbi:MAG: hypothetical protein K2J32_09510 [Ruminococcus sp.]|nr:hypothetical protein [Ruminococcus sp.]